MGIFRPQKRLFGPGFRSGRGGKATYEVGRDEF
jgi:hypothetical protein